METAEASKNRFEGIADLLNKRAISSNLMASVFLFVVLVLLIITAFVLSVSGTLAKKDVASAKPISTVQKEVLTPVHLNNVASCGEVTVAVGDRGTVVVSRNLARSWTNIENAVNDDFFAVSFSADCSHVVAVGEDGALLQSSDYGDSWTAVTNLTTNDLTSVAIDENGSTAIAVGDGGIFVVSSDGMVTWEKTLGLEGEDGNSVILSNEGHKAIITSRRGPVLVFRNENGTFKRESKFSRDRNRFEVAAITDDSEQKFRALIVGRDRVILAYTSHGIWNHINEPSRGEPDLVDVVVHGKKIIAVGEEGVYMTSPSWRKSQSGVGNDLVSVAMNSSGTAVAVGHDGTVLFASFEDKWWAGRGDGQPLWKLVNIGTTSELLDVTFVSEDRFVIVGEKIEVIEDESEKTLLYVCDVTTGPVRCMLSEGVGKKTLEEEEVWPDDYEASANGEGTTVRSGDHWWADGSFLELLTNNVLRLGAITLFLFLAGHLFRLARYQFRLGAYYQARADAFGLISDEFVGLANMDEVEQAMMALSPDHLETKLSPGSAGTVHPATLQFPWSR